MSTQATAKKDGPRFEVRTPATGFRGERAGLRFVEGVAHTDDQSAAETCRGLGYRVTDLRPPAAPAPKK